MTHPEPKHTQSNQSEQEKNEERMLDIHGHTRT